MRTLRPVSQETYEKIGAAYAICSEYPEVFGEVRNKEFCSMFVPDILDESVDVHEARKKAAAHEMYEMLEAAVKALNEYNPNSTTAVRIERLLDLIDDVGKEASCDE